MGIPQIILLTLYGIVLLIKARLHGKKQDNHNFWMSLIDVALIIGLLIWGGFFK